MVSSNEFASCPFRHEKNNAIREKEISFFIENILRG
jgi:hypothetical protein